MKNYLKTLIFSLILALGLTSANNAYTQVGLFIRPNTSSLSAPVTGQTWLFNSSTNNIVVWNGSSWQIISQAVSNMVATTAPTTANDNTQGYSTSSFWYNTVSTDLYVCVDATTSAAVWVLANNLGTVSIPLSYLQQGSATSGQSLMWNGTTWAPSNPLVGLNSLLQSGAATGQVPAWNGTAWVPTNAAGSSAVDANTIFSNTSGSSAIPAFNALYLTATDGLTGGGYLTTSPSVGIAIDAALPGSPTTATQSPNDNSTRIATTAYVDSAVGAAGVSSITGDGTLITNSGSTGAVTITLGTVLPATITGSSLTSLGTIGTGTWNGTAIGLGYIAGIANNTVVGSVTSGTNPPVALTATQLTTIPNLATDTLQGMMPALTNGQIAIGQTAANTSAQTISGDATLAHTGALTLATVNSNVGSFTNANITVNAKGLVTAAANGSSSSGVSSFTGDGTLITNSGSTGAVTITLGTVLPATITGSSLTSLGTIGTGTWNGTAIGIGYGGTGTTNSTLLDGSSVLSIDWLHRYLVDTSTTTSIDWANRFTYDNSGVKSIDYNNRYLTDSSVNQSINWVNRILYASDGSTTLLNYATNTGATTITQSSSDNSTKLATTAYVQAQFPLPIGNGGTGTATGAGANTVFGNNTGSTAAPGFQTMTTSQLPQTVLTFGGNGGTTPFRQLPTSGTLTGEYWYIGNYATTGTITCNACRWHVTGTVTINNAITVNTEFAHATSAAGNLGTTQPGFGAGGAGANATGACGGGYGGKGGNGSYVGGGYYVPGGATYTIDQFLGGSPGGDGFNATTTDTGGTGGSGGGGFYIEASGNVTVGANITANGGNGSTGSGTNYGGGGGGSGGGIDIRSLGTITLNSGVTLSANGGNGGTGAGSGINASGGGGGIIFVSGSTVTNNGNSPTVTAGAAGTGGSGTAGNSGSAGVSTLTSTVYGPRHN